MSSEETIISRQTHRDIDEALAWLDELSGDGRKKNGSSMSNLPTWLRSDLQLGVPEPPSDSALSVATAARPARDNDNLSWLDSIASGLGAPTEELPTMSWGDSNIFALRDSEVDDLAELLALPAENDAIAPPPASRAVPDRILTPAAAADDDLDEQTHIADLLDGADLPAPILPPTATTSDTLSRAAAAAEPSADPPTIVSEIPLSQRWVADDLEIDAELAALLDGNAADRDADDLLAVNPGAIPDDPDEAIAWLESMARREQARGRLPLSRKVEIDPEEDSLILEPPPFDDDDLPDDEIAQALRDFGEQLGIEPPASGKHPTLPPLGKPAGEIEAFMRGLEADLTERPGLLPTESGTTPPTPPTVQLPEDVSEALAWLEQLVSGSDTPLDETTLELSAADVNTLIERAGLAEAADTTPVDVAAEPEAVAAPNDQPDDEPSEAADELTQPPTTDVADSTSQSAVELLPNRVSSANAERDAVINELLGYADTPEVYQPTVVTSGIPAARLGNGAPAAVIDSGAADAEDDPALHQPTVFDQPPVAGGMPTADDDPELNQPTMITTDAPSDDPAEHQPTIITPDLASGVQAIREESVAPTILDLPQRAAVDAAELQTTVVPGEMPTTETEPAVSETEPAVDDEAHTFVETPALPVVPTEAVAEGVNEPANEPPVDDLGDALDWLEQFAADNQGSSFILQEAATPIIAPRSVAAAGAASAEGAVEDLLGAAREQAVAAVDRGDYRTAADQYAMVLASTRSEAAGLVVKDLLPLVQQIDDQPILFRILGDAYGKQGQYQQAAEAYRRGLAML